MKLEQARHDELMRALAGEPHVAAPIVEHVAEPIVEQRVAEIKRELHAFQASTLAE
jgi:hypothetical protein